MKNNTRNILEIILAVLVLVGFLAAGKVQRHNFELTEDLDELLAAKQALETYTDSLTKVANERLEQVKVLTLDNEQFKQLNRELSRRASTRTRVKYVTTSEVLQQVKDTLRSLELEAVFAHSMADKYKNDLELIAHEKESTDSLLAFALQEWEKSQAIFPLTFEKKDDYVDYSITVFGPNEAQISIQTLDTLSFAHTSQRKWFLGKRTYTVFAQSQSPYTQTKTHSYRFSNRK